MLKEIKADIFTETSNIAVFLSRDGHPGVSIAKQFNERFNIYQKIKDNYAIEDIMNRKIDIIKIGNVICLFSKDSFLQKYSYDNLKENFKLLKSYLIRNDILSVAIPKIGCGMDGLEWSKVRDIIKEVFNDSNIRVRVYYLE